MEKKKKKKKKKDLHSLFQHIMLYLNECVSVECDLFCL